MATPIIRTQYRTYDHTLHKNRCPGGHKSYNFGRPSLVIITIYLVCLIYAWE